MRLNHGTAICGNGAAPVKSPLLVSDARVEELSRVLIFPGQRPPPVSILFSGGRGDALRPL